jgi:hypothetical protein
MKVRTIKISRLCTGQVKAPGREMDIPKDEAERLIAEGLCISLEPKEKNVSKLSTAKNK